MYQRSPKGTDASLPLPDCVRWVPDYGPYVDREATVDPGSCLFYRSDIDSLLKFAEDGGDVIIDLF